MQGDQLPVLVEAGRPAGPGLGVGRVPDPLAVVFNLDIRPGVESQLERGLLGVLEDEQGGHAGQSRLSFRHLHPPAWHTVGFDRFAPEFPLQLDESVVEFPVRWGMPSALFAASACE